MIIIINISDTIPPKIMEICLLDVIKFDVLRTEIDDVVSGYCGDNDDDDNNNKLLRGSQIFYRE